MTQDTSPNFNFLDGHAPQLARLGTLAERYFAEDPNTSTMKLRQYGELLASETAAKLGVYIADDTRQISVLTRLGQTSGINKVIIDLFHQLRKSGNQAVHALKDDHGTALTNLKIAHKLAIWYHRSFGNDRDFTATPFSPPEKETLQDEALRLEISELQQKLEQALSEKERASRLQAKEARLRLSVEEERQSLLKLNEEAEAATSELQVKLEALQEQSEKASPKDISQLVSSANKFAEAIDLDEADTRRIIDGQLRDAGWEVNSDNIKYSKGVRPQKGKNIAIAEWPTETGPSDYVLFIGLKAVATVEAKRKRLDVSGAIDQAKRYSKGFQSKGADFISDEAPWSDGDKTSYYVPLAFSTNGRPYLKQLETASGIWFCDLRKPTNLRRALTGWYSPEGIEKLLDQDEQKAAEKLETEGFDYGFTLRDYQKKAILKSEEAISNGQREILLAMATGTGKTKTCLAMAYRLLNTNRFRRILFLVDRSALGEQTGEDFQGTQMENLQTFANIFGVKELGDGVVESDTRIQIATVQSFVKRIMYNDDSSAVPTVDQYDCIIVDECHRGYLLDKELGDSEFAFRDQDDYVSKYRRVIEHFDAVKIGLTATPALHTTDIFGSPIYRYTYREAVIDGWLTDHEAPVRLITKLAENGIEWEAGEEVEVIDNTTGEIDTVHLPDNLKMDIEAFNKRVITPDFNRVICEALADYIDPSMQAKTLIFCVNDKHADLVVQKLKEAMQATYGEIEDNAIAKITGKSDKPSQLIRRYKNETLPNIAVTVDLLTTGIDVPKICNLVFLRQVNSRILFEQMLGRATRLCDEIGKETFRIFDAVDIYNRLKKVTEMKPVAANPKTTFAHLVEGLEKVIDEKARDTIKDELTAKLHRASRRYKDETIEKIELITKTPLDDFMDWVKDTPVTEVAEWFKDNSHIIVLLDTKGRSFNPFTAISEHNDELLDVRTGYGDAEKPEDYLDSFKVYIEDNKNKLPALLAVTQRPKDLTRQQLKGLQLQLESEGFREQDLRAAWRDTKNEDIAANIIGFIRQAAIGDPLLPYEQRVDMALKSIMSAGEYTAVQKQWLTRIGKQLKKEVIVDKSALNSGEFARRGGYDRLNKVFEGRLSKILDDITDAIWHKTA
ncbi:MAG: type I restriction-modification system endonuclease [Rhizobiales bacterium]|nr:type I restriction-modification system endonuclease [Hyphomicrobiales bacterium]NRB13246.1 type I restriction-modification system endonuclease [Hyphomicrobiales bacterium]